MYGVPLNERPDGVVDEVIKKLAKQIEGTFYMGRILLSLSLSPNEKAGLGLQPLGGYKEPAIIKYIVRCDTFELQVKNNKKILIKQYKYYFPKI